MPTAIPAAEPRLSARQTARFLWLCIRVRYLHRRMERASLRVSRLGAEKVGGRPLHFSRAWLTCHAEVTTLLYCSEPPEVLPYLAVFAVFDPAVVR